MNEKHQSKISRAYEKDEVINLLEPIWRAVLLDGFFGFNLAAVYESQALIYSN